MSSIFDSLPESAPIDVFRVLREFREDTDDRQVNLIIGVYRNDDCSSHVLGSVQRAKRDLVDKTEYDHEYLPIPGHTGFRESATQFVLGSDYRDRYELVPLSFQCVGGSGAIRLGADVLHSIVKATIAYHPDPTWGNHSVLLRSSGIEDVRSYRYWDKLKNTIDFQGLIEDLSSAPERSIIILHVCAHNPTGADLSRTQWEAIADLVIARNLIPFFDSAFQGLCNEDPEDDAWPVRYFASRHIPLLCAQTFSKSFSLYSERVGNLVIMMFKCEDESRKIQSLIELLAAANYTSPPALGARIVHRILTNASLFKDWLVEMRDIRSRVAQMRTRLQEALELSSPSNDWTYLRDNKGMFCLLGLSASQIIHLRRQFHVYIPSNGRLSFAGLTLHNVDYVAHAISESMKAD